MSAPRDVNWLTNGSANRVRIADNYETMAKRAEQRLRDQNSIRREIASAKPSPKPLESPNAPKSHDRVQLPDSRVPDADCAESLGDLLPPSPPAEKDHAFPPCELSRSNSATS